MVLMAGKLLDRMHFLLFVDGDADGELAGDVTGWLGEYAVQRRN